MQAHESAVRAMAWSKSGTTSSQLIKTERSNTSLRILTLCKPSQRMLTRLVGSPFHPTTASSLAEETTVCSKSGTLIVPNRFVSLRVTVGTSNVSIGTRRKVYSLAGVKTTSLKFGIHVPTPRHMLSHFPWPQKHRTGDQIQPGRIALCNRIERHDGETVRLALHGRSFHAQRSPKGSLLARFPPAPQRPFGFRWK